MGVAPTVYRWDDSGAPAYPGSAAGYLGSDFIGRVIKACLIDGYSDKPGAGWTLHEVVWPTSSSAGHLIVEPASQTGVAKIWLGSYADTHVTINTLADGWDGNALVSPINRNYTESGSSLFRFLDDERTDRWCVIANDKAMVMLTWRDPATLTGQDLSVFNSVAMVLGEVLPVSANVLPAAVPNIAGCVLCAFRYTSGYEFGLYNANIAKGCMSRVCADGSLYTGSADEDFVAYVPAVGGQFAEVWPDSATYLPLFPAVLHDRVLDKIVGRWPGLWLMPGEPSNEQLLIDRDTNGRWSGDTIEVDGLSAVFIASQKSYGYVSLSPEDWP